MLFSFVDEDKTDETDEMSMKEIISGAVLKAVIVSSGDEILFKFHPDAKFSIVA